MNLLKLGSLRLGQAVLSSLLKLLLLLLLLVYKGKLKSLDWLLLSTLDLLFLHFLDRQSLFALNALLLGLVFVLERNLHLLVRLLELLGVGLLVGVWCLLVDLKHRREVVLLISLSTFVEIGRHWSCQIVVLLLEHHVAIDCLLLVGGYISLVRTWLLLLKVRVLKHCTSLVWVHRRRFGDIRHAAQVGLLMDWVRLVERLLVHLHLWEELRHAWHHCVAHGESVVGLLQHSSGAWLLEHHHIRVKC